MARKKKPKAPGRLFIPGAGVHRIAVLLINTHDAHGRPKLCTFLHDEQSIDIDGGEEFVTAYVPDEMLRKVK